MKYRVMTYLVKMALFVMSIAVFVSCNKDEKKESQNEAENLLSAFFSPLILVHLVRKQG